MPKIGLLSDSHGRVPTTRAAVTQLTQRHADLLIHLGDVGTVEVLDELLSQGPNQQPLPVHLVFGNTDWDWQDLSRYATGLGMHVHHPAGRLPLPDGQLAFCHGHDNAPMDAALHEQARYLCHGHTHRPTDTRQGATRIINPGALFRADTYTCALLDTDADELTFITLS